MNVLRKIFITVLNSIKPVGQSNLVVLIYKKDNSMKYHVKLTWVKSTDPNVKSQHLKVTSGDVVITDSDLTPDVELFEFDADQNAVLHAELTVSDGVLTSTPVVSDATVPAFPTSPIPPTDLKFEVEFVNG